MANNPVMIAEYSSELEAEMAKAQLEAEGISSWILKDDAGGMQPQLQYVEGVKLFVDEKNVEEALGILEWIDDIGEYDDDFEDEKEGGDDKDDD